MNKISKKVLAVLELYDDFILKNRQFKIMQKIANQPMPKHKQRKLGNIEANLFVRSYAAQSKYSKRYKKLNKKEKAEAIAIRMADPI